MFLRHEACPSCGSSDGRAVYDDHTYCFVCREHSGGDPLKRFQAVEKTRKTKSSIGETKSLPPQAHEWLDKYGLTDDEKALFSWHEGRQHLIYREGDFYNARSWNPDDPKYVSYGTKPFSIRGKGTPCAVCEDLVSGIRYARHCASLVLFGASMPAAVRANLPSRVLIHLDKDKFLESAKLSYELSCVGIDSRVVVTGPDPKELSDEQLRSIINA